MSKIINKNYSLCSLRLGVYKKYTPPKELKLVASGEQNWGIEEDGPGQMTSIINNTLTLQDTFQTFLFI